MSKYEGKLTLLLDSATYYKDRIKDISYQIANLQAVKDELNRELDKILNFNKNIQGYDKRNHD